MVATVEQRSIKRQVTEKQGTQEAFLITDDNSYFRDYLHFAIRRCLKSAESYKHAAEIVVGEEALSFLQSMVELKRAEAELLRQFHPEGTTNTGEGGQHLPVGSMLGYLLDMELRPIETMEDACRFAKQNEQNDLHIYTRLADLEKDATTKKLFLFLSGLQKAHVDFVNSHASIEELASLGDTLTAASVKW